MPITEPFRMLEEELIKPLGPTDTFGRGSAEAFRMEKEERIIQSDEILHHARSQINAQELNVLQKYLSGESVQSLASQIGGDAPLLNVVRSTLAQLQKALS